LYDLEQGLLRQGFHNFKPVVASVCDVNALEAVFKLYKPHYIFHAAAYKHVPLMEQYPKQAIKVNVLGTKQVADLAVKYKATRFVMVSTDKAVNPTNVMGATKRAAELYIGTLAQKHQHIKFMTTRFGNVLGSNGSVIPLFKRQLAEGGPLTVTHKDIIRYFMTIPEACQLVIEAGLSGQGSEIFVFDMGDPVRIFDLAKNMIRMSGFEYPNQMGIKITGLRPGEKLYEELLGASEDDLPTHNPKIKIAKVVNGNSNVILDTVAQFKNTISGSSDLELVALLKTMVPEFVSQNSKFQSLDSTTQQTKETLMKVVNF
jgi:FlaA1/EpsC-like NDP-sugar epimerase